MEEKINCELQFQFRHNLSDESIELCGFKVRNSIFEMHAYLFQLFIYVNVYLLKYVRSDSCTDFNVQITSSGVTDKTLLGSAYFESSDFQNILSCGIRCLKQRKCKSINFNSETLLCQLNTENHITKTSSLNVSHSGFQYYNTQEWSQVRVFERLLLLLCIV